MQSWFADPALGWAEDVAWVGVDQLGIIQALSGEFTAAFGWSAEQLVGRPLHNLMPANMRDAHNIGFSCFVETGRGALLGQPVSMEVLTASGEAVMTETVIQAARFGGQWCFGAQLIPVCKEAG